MKKFGTFEVDLRARELRKGGIRIRLQDQPLPCRRQRVALVTFAVKTGEVKSSSFSTASRN